MLASADPDLFLKVTSVVTVTTFALLALAGGHRRTPNVFLAVFLLLIAGNQAAEVVRTWVLADPGDVFWHRAATILASADPFFLYYFSCVFPRRRVTECRRSLVVTGLVSLALVASAPFVTSWWHVGTAGTLHALVRTVFTFLVYYAVARHFLRESARDPTAPAPRYLYYAACFAVIPLVNQWGAIQAAVGDLVTLTPGPGGGWRGLALFAVLLAVAGAGLVTSVPRTDVRGRRIAATGVAAASGLAVFVHAAPIVTVFYPVTHEWAVERLAWTGRATAALRWEAFSLLAAVAVVRHDALGASVRARRRAARVLAAAAVLAAGGVLVFGTARVLGLDDGRPLTLQAGLVLAAVTLSQAFRSLVDRIAESAYGVPRDGDAGAGLAAYRRAAEQAAAEGRELARDPELARLRRELRIDGASAAVVADVVQDAIDQRPLEPGRRLAGCYRVERLIARGGVGRVLLARDEVSGARVVLKEVPRDDDGLARDALHEARVAGSIEHAHVVRLLDVVERARTVVLVTEFVEGGSLEAHVQKHGPLDASTGLRVLDDVLAGLEAAHARGVVHRDVKPGNVLLTRDLRAKLADFGLARVQSGSTLAAGALVDYAGTWAFMAPERKRGAPATPASDVHAVALVARDCVGTPLPPAVDAVLDRALAEDPAARWPDAGAMRRALAEAGARVIADTGEASDPRRSRHPS